MQNNGGGGKLLVRAATGGGSSNPQFITGVYDQTVSLLLHMNGTNGGTSFVDNGIHGYSVNMSGTPFSSATTSTSQSKFGGSSGYFNRSAPNALRFDISANAAGIAPLTLGAGDFTVESWVYLNSMPGSESYPDGFWITGWGENSSNLGFDFYIGTSNINLAIYNYNDTRQIYAPHGMTTGQWYHVAVSRSGNSFRAFIDGVQIGSTTTYNGPAYTPTTGGIAVGIAEPFISGGCFNGYMQDFRITKGLARYTANFTPPAAAFTNPNNLAALPASPTVGQLVLSDASMFVCTNATGPVWKGYSLTPL